MLPRSLLCYNYRRPFQVHLAFHLCHSIFKYSLLFIYTTQFSNTACYSSMPLNFQIQLAFHLCHSIFTNNRNMTFNSDEKHGFIHQVINQVIYKIFHIIKMFHWVSSHAQVCLMKVPFEIVLPTAWWWDRHLLKRSSSWYDKRIILGTLSRQAKIFLSLTDF